MIEEILKFADKHAKVVILSLLTIIVAGGIGGGLWIHTLQTQLEQHEKLTSERLQLIEQRYAADVRALQQANSILQGEAKIIQTSSTEVVARLQEISSLASDIRSKGRITQDIAPKLQAATEKVTEASQTMLRALERTKDIDDWTRRLQHPEATPGALSEASSAMEFWFLPAVLIPLIVVFGVIFWRKRKRRRPVRTT